MLCTGFHDFSLLLSSFVFGEFPQALCENKGSKSGYDLYNCFMARDRCFDPFHNWFTQQNTAANQIGMMCGGEESAKVRTILLEVRTHNNTEHKRAYIRRRWFNLRMHGMIPEFLIRYYISSCLFPSCVKCLQWMLHTLLLFRYQAWHRMIALFPLMITVLTYLKVPYISNWAILKI